MGCNYKKVRYQREGSYGSLEDCTLYIKSSRSTDITSYYDNEGNLLFCSDDCTNSLEQALRVALISDWDELSNLDPGDVEFLKSENI